ncbi:hypothetical protein QAD02_016385 [Eretmocerus hayati]|uniref:Uncharacterized protein n=1 Tax=Eretmocerus hayati TaxID=131215 RepID=A0ACC2PBY2_9HYME|nr:hypothetical protein QAD02_016385 [Eretmocerus hayati]
MATSNTKNCILCNKSDARSCTRCRSIHYCSKACQKKDWPIHRHLCSTFASFDPPEQSTDHQRIKAIFFPVDETKPQMVWLPWNWRMFEDTRCQFPDPYPFLGLDESRRMLSRVDTIFQNKVLGRELSDLIYIHYIDNFLNDGSKVNKSIETITGFYGTSQHWRGPMIAYGVVGQHGVHDIVCRDIDLGDFRHIVDFLQMYCGRPPEEAQLKMFHLTTEQLFALGR